MANGHSRISESFLKKAIPLFGAMLLGMGVVMDVVVGQDIWSLLSERLILGAFIVLLIQGGVIYLVQRFKEEYEKLLLVLLPPVEGILIAVLLPNLTSAGFVALMSHFLTAGGVFALVMGGTAWAVNDDLGINSFRIVAAVSGTIVLVYYIVRSGGILSTGGLGATIFGILFFMAFDLRAAPNVMARHTGVYRQSLGMFLDVFRLFTLPTVRAHFRER